VIVVAAFAAMHLRMTVIVIAAFAAMHLRMTVIVIAAFAAMHLRMTAIVVTLIRCKRGIVARRGRVFYRFEDVVYDATRAKREVEYQVDARPQFMFSGRTFQTD